MKQAAIGRDLTEGSISRTLLVFSIPLMLANLLQIVYNMVDMAIVGRCVGSVAQAAVINGGDIVTFATAFFLGFSSAGQVIIAQYIGKGNRKMAGRTVGTMITFMTLLSIGITVAGLFLTDWFLKLMNVDPLALEQARQYTRVCFWGMLFIGGYNEISAIMRGMGDSRHPLMFVAIAAGVNLFLDLIFVVILGWQARGAAFATVIGQAVSFICSLIFLYLRRSSFQLEFKPRDFIPDREIFPALMRLGIPMAINYASVSFSKLFVNSFINSYGVVATAVTGIGQKIGQCATIVTNAINTGGASMIGQNFGAGKQERVAKTVYISFGICLVFIAVLSVIMILFPEQIFSLFNTDPEVLAMAHSYVLPAVIRFFGFAFRAPMTSLINGIGASNLSLLSAVLDSIAGRIGLAILMGIGFNMGILGFWMGDALAGYIPFIIGGVFFWSGAWRKRKPISDRE